MSQPTARVLAILELLQSQRRVTGAEIARRLAVDARTVRRYISRLEDLGIPITAERGRDGAYLLVPGYKLPPMMFTDDEALALSVGLLAARGLGLAGSAGPVAAVDSARGKLARVMPSALQRRVRAVDETVTLDLPAASAPPANAVLMALSGAAQSRHRVSLSYRPAQGADTEREFDPYGLAYRSGRWYGVGWCHLRRGLRSFRLDRVLAVRPLDIPFDRPEHFDALDHLTRSIATLLRAFAPEVLLVTDLATAQRELFPVAGTLEPAAGGVLLRAQVDDLDWFARELARLPFGFEIRAPVELRAALALLAERLASIAGKNGPRL